MRIFILISTMLLISCVESTSEPDENKIPSESEISTGDSGVPISESDDPNVPADDSEASNENSNTQVEDPENEVKSSELPMFKFNEGRFNFSKFG